MGFVLRVLAVHAGTLFHVGVGHLHADGVADVIGVLLHQILQAELVQELAVVLVLAVLLEVEGDGGAAVRLGAGGDFIAVQACGFPVPGLIGAKGLGVHGHPGADHKGGVEAHAKLADDVHLVLLLGLLLKLEGAAAGDDAQVVVQLLLGHADAVVADREGAGLLVHGQLDGEVLPGKAGGAVLQGAVIELVNGVAGVGNQLPQENFLMGVDGVNHQVQQALGFCLKFFHCHGFKLLPFQYRQTAQRLSVNKNQRPASKGCSS